MEAKRRSSLRKSFAPDAGSNDMKSSQKKGISFSGKKSIRVFSGEEEPRAWNKSFEISDHLNVNDTPTIICPPSQNSQNNSDENKENVYEDKEIEQVDSCNPNKNSTNLSISNISGLRPSNEFINITDQLSRNYQIEDSVDITLFENEKRCQKGVKNIDQNNTNLFSFSMAANVKDVPFGEKTFDFMCDLRNHSKEIEEGTRTCNLPNENGVISGNENECKIRNNNSSTNRNKIADEPMMYYMSESLTVKSVTQICGTKNARRKSVYEEAAMQLTLNEAQEHDKENVYPFVKQKKNETQTCTSQMEIEEEMLSPSQAKENCNKGKLRPTIYFDQQLETSTMKNINTSPKKLEKTMVFENTKTSRPSIYFNQTIDADGKNNNKISSFKEKPSWSPKNFKENITLEKTKTLRQSIYFNQTMDIDEQTATNNEDNNRAKVSKDYDFENRKFSRPSIYFNKTMDIDKQAATNNENNKKAAVSGSLTKNLEGTKAFGNGKISRPSIYFNKTMDIDDQTATIGKNNNDVIMTSVTPNSSPKKLEMDIAFEKSKILRPSIYFNQTMNIDVETAKTTEDNTKNAEPKAKSPIKLKENIALKNTKPIRSSIYFNQSIDTETHVALADVPEDLKENLPLEHTKTERPSIYVNQSIDIVNQTTTKSESHNNNKGAVPKVKSCSSTKKLPEYMALENTRSLRPSIYFDQSIDADTQAATNSKNKNMTEIKENVGWESTKTIRPSICFNQSIDVDAQTKTNSESVKLFSLPKHAQESIGFENSKTLRPSIHFNQTIDADAHTVTESETKNINQPCSIILNQPVETSPVSLGTNFCRKTINVNEDMDTSEDAASCKNLNVSKSSQIAQKQDQPAKIAFRRICLPTPNISRSIFDVPKKRMLQFAKGQEENTKIDQSIDTETHVAANNENNTMAGVPKDLKENHLFENTKTIRPNIYFNQPIDIDNKTATNSENNNNMGAATNVKACSPPKELQDNIAKHLRQSIYFNQSVDTDDQTVPIKENNNMTDIPEELKKNIALENAKNIRPSIYCNQSIDIDDQTKTNSENVKPCLSPRNLHKNINFGNSKIIRPSIHFNQSIKTDIQTAINDENIGVMHKVNPCSIILNQPVETSPVSLATNLCRKTMNLNEDMDTSHVTSISCKNVTDCSSSQNLQKQEQPAKIVFRKICLPTPNRAKSIFDIHQRFGKVQEQKEQTVSAADIPTNSVKKDHEKKLEKSLSFSLESFKNISLVSDNSSPLIPLEFKGYTLRQLHDEIESGKIKVFENAIKTPISNMKIIRKAAFDYSIEDTQISQKKSLLFENADIPTTSNKCKYRYSQADEIMLDNTSFLARAKLSDETMSHKSSKRDSTQFNDTMDVFDETLADAASKLGDGPQSILKIKSICDQGNYAAMLQSEQPIFATQETNINHSKNTTCFVDTMNVSTHLQQEDGKGNDIASLTAIQENATNENNESICNEKPDNGLNNENPNRKTLYFDKRIPLEDTLKEIQETDLNKNTNTCRKTLFFETKIQEESIMNDEEKKYDNYGHLCRPRKTLQYNDEISIENPNMDTENGGFLDESEACLPQQTKRKTVFFEEKIPEEMILKQDTNRAEVRNKVACSLAQTRKTVYYNNEISPEKNTTFNESNNFDNAKLQKEAIMDMTVECLDLNKCEHSKNLPFQDKISARRKSVYTPENMDLSLDGDLQNKSGIDELQEVEDQVMSSENIADENKNIDEMGQSFQPAENYQFTEPTESLNAAKMFLSRRYSKNSFVTPKKSFGTNKNCSLFMTPRLSLLEFERLEEEENKHEGQNLYKRCSINLTPVLSIPKKKLTLALDNSLQDAMEEIKEHNEPQILNLNDSIPNNKQTLAFEDSLQDAKEEIKEKNQPQIVNLNDSLLKNKETLAFEDYLQDAKNEFKEKGELQIVNLDAESTSIDNAQKETDSQLEVEVDNLGESIQFMRRATTFTKQEDVIIDEHNSLQLPKPSIFESNPITISDVSVFFEAQRKSQYEITQTEISLNLENPNTVLPQQTGKAKHCLETRFLNLPDEDLEKTYLSLVREDEEDDKDDTANINDLKQQELNIKERTLEKHAIISSNLSKLKRERNSVNNLRNESLICRKCKRCQETVLGETTSTASESFVLPELPPIPDIGLDRLRRLRKRPSIADVHVWWKRLCLDLSMYNPNISDDDDEMGIDFDDEPEDENSVVTKVIRKFHEDIKSFKAKLRQSSPNKSPSLKLPFVLRLAALLRENFKNWIFDYQSQICGTLFFSHRKLYTFTLMLTFEKVDHFANEISVKSIKLGIGHIKKKNWKPIDFVLEFELKLNLPLNLQWLCKGSTEADIAKMLQEIDHICLETLKITNELQLICFSNQATIKSYLRGGGAYVCKTFRQIVKRPNTDVKYVKKTEIHVELLNLKQLSFKNIIFPQLHNFREEVHLLPTGLQFLREFLPNALDYLKDK